jgi:hypothetical protein
VWHPTMEATRTAVSVLSQDARLLLPAASRTTSSWTCSPAFPGSQQSLRRTRHFCSGERCSERLVSLLGCLPSIGNPGYAARGGFVLFVGHRRSSQPRHVCDGWPGTCRRNVVGAGYRGATTSPRGGEGRLLGSCLCEFLQLVVGERPRSRGRGRLLCVLPEWRTDHTSVGHSLESSNQRLNTSGLRRSLL